MEMDSNMLYSRGLVPAPPTTRAAPRANDVFKTPLGCVYVLAFGLPRPFHRILLQNWSYCSTLRFHLLTDQTEAWSRIMPSFTGNLRLVATTPEGLFRRSPSYFGCMDFEDFTRRFLSKFYNRIDGWTACGLRPLLDELFRLDSESPYWGWMDYDVLLNPDAVGSIMERRESAGLFYPMDGPVWEHFKLFHRSLDLKSHFDDIKFAVDVENRPLEVQTAYFVTDKIPLSRIPNRSIACHWKFYDRFRMINQYDVHVASSFAMKSETGFEVVYFIADTESRAYSDNAVSKIQALWSAGQTPVFRYVRQA
jgi:hypothetical protein